MSDLHQIAKTDFDLVVIGGGCVGTAVAMFAARAGLKTALVEKNDFGSGTTAASTELVHGGLQYLFRLKLGIVRKSNRYACRVYRSAAHLCRAMPIIVPHYRGGPYPFIALRTVMRVYEWYNRRYKHAPPAQRLTAQEIIEQVPGIRHEGLVGGVKYYEWRVDAGRLCLANALLAARHGALVRNHAAVVGLELRPEGRSAVTIEDERTAERVALNTRLVINATGPWTDELCRMAGLAEHARIRPTRGAHIFLPKLADVGLLVEFVDGRHGVALPREHLTMVGTTDDDYYGELDDMQATSDEVAYLLQGIERLLPGLSADDVLDTKVGVRPTIFQYGKTEDKLSRDHRVEDHGAPQLPGLISVYGGKLATHTLMAEDVLGVVGRHLQTSLDVPEDYRLPGAPDEDVETYRHRAAAAAVEKYGVEPSAAEALVRRYGTEHQAVLELIAQRPELSENLCRCRHDGRPFQYVLAAEVHYGVGHEWALSVDDIRRRTGLGLGECRRNDCLEAARSILRTLACRETDSAAGPAGERASTPSASTSAPD